MSNRLEWSNALVWHYLHDYMRRSAYTGPLAHCAWSLQRLSLFTDQNTGAEQRMHPGNKGLPVRHSGIHCTDRPLLGVCIDARLT